MHIVIHYLVYSFQSSILSINSIKMLKNKGRKSLFYKCCISFHHECFYDESAFLCKKNKKVFFKLRREYLIGDKDYKS